MPLREFLRGGYQRVYEPTVVTKHGYPLFSVFPGPASKSFTDDKTRASIPPGPTGPSPNGG